MVGKGKVVRPNALIFYCKTKEARGAKYAEVLSWLKQKRNHAGHATKVFLFAESAVCKNSFQNIEKEPCLVNVCVR